MPIHTHLYEYYCGVKVYTYQGNTGFYAIIEVCSGHDGKIKHPVTVSSDKYLGIHRKIKAKLRFSCRNGFMVESGIPGDIYKQYGKKKRNKTVNDVLFDEMCIHLEMSYVKKRKRNQRRSRHNVVFGMVVQNMANSY